MYIFRKQFYFNNKKLFLWYHEIKNYEIDAKTQLTVNVFKIRTFLFKSQKINNNNGKQTGF